MSLPVTDLDLVDIDSLASLTQPDVRGWLVAALTGADLNVSGPGDGMGMPHYIFLQLSFRPDVGNGFRDKVQLAMLDGLYDLASDDDASIWRGVGGDRLLQLVEPLMRDPAYRSRAQLALVHIVSAPERYCQLVPNLHLRALQTLVRIGYVGVPDFWKRQFQDGADDRYGPLVLAGLSSLGPDVALNWLVSAPSSRLLDEATRGILSELLTRYSVVHMRAAVTRALASPVIGARRAALQRLEESFDAAPKDVGPEAASERAREFLDRTGQDAHTGIPRRLSAGP